MATECTFGTGKLPQGGLTKNSLVLISDRPDMTASVYRGRKATNETNKNIRLLRKRVVRITDRPNMTIAFNQVVDVKQQVKQIKAFVMLTCPCNVDPLNPTFP